MRIIINGVTHKLSRDRMYYSSIVAIALKDVPVKNWQDAIVEYAGARQKQTYGRLHPCHSIRIKDCTCFTVTPAAKVTQPIFSSIKTAI